MADKRKPLRAVAEGETRARAPKTIGQAADDGTQRELLVAMRTRVATAVESQLTPARDLAALTKRLLEIVKEIESIDAREAEEAEENADATADADWEAV